MIEWVEIKPLTLFLFIKRGGNMSTLVLDDCLQNLVLAQESMKEWIPMTEYEWIFEATEDPVVAANAEKNEATMEKSSLTLVLSEAEFNELLLELSSLQKNF